MIRTTRLIIDSYTDSDMHKMTYLLQNKEIKETFMIPDWNKEQCQSYFKKLKSLSNDNNHFEKGIYLNGILIGFINDVSINDKTIELGYVIDPEYKNNGYATEVLKAVTSYLFDKGYDIIRIGAFSNNYASIRVIEKCGYIRDDYTDIVDYHNVSHICVYYLMKKDNFTS